jgi:hypothetical protein
LWHVVVVVVVAVVVVVVSFPPLGTVQQPSGLPEKGEQTQSSRSSTLGSSATSSTIGRKSVSDDTSGANAR